MIDLAFKCTTCGTGFETAGGFAGHMKTKHAPARPLANMMVPRLLGLPVDDDDDDDDDDEADDRTQHFVAMCEFDELAELRLRAGKFIAERNELGLEKIVVRFDELVPIFSARAKLYEKAARDAVDLRRLVDRVRREAG